MRSEGQSKDPSTWITGLKRELIVDDHDSLLCLLYDTLDLFRSPNHEAGNLSSELLSGSKRGKGAGINGFLAVFEENQGVWTRGCRVASAERPAGESWAYTKHGG